MKTRAFCCILLLAILSGVALSQNETEAIERLLRDQVSGWNAGSIEGYMLGYWNSDSTLFVSGGSATRGYGAVLARYKKSYDSPEKMGRLEFAELQVRLKTPTLAVATGIWRLFRSKDQPWGRFTLIVEKKPEGWRITHDHTSSAN